MLNLHSLWLVREPADMRASTDAPTTQAAEHLPRESDTTWSLTAEQLAWFTAGVDGQRLSAWPLPAWAE
ncbi:transposase [Escherichia coli]|nr:transposase [Escherichia coli]